MGELGRSMLLMASAALLLGTAPGDRPVDLLSDGLPLWFRWIGVPYPGLEGVPEGAPIGDGMAGVPLGVDGYADVFTLIREGGEPVLRVSGKLYGALTSKTRYGNYHLRFQYRWGEATYPPRQPDQPRDSGVLVHLTGGLEDAHWSVFLMGLESQVSEGRTGDLLFMSNKDDRVQPEVEARTADGVQWNPKAAWRQIGGAGADPIFKHSGAHEAPHGQWTTVDLYTAGDEGVSAVNGHVVMAWRRARVRLADGTVRPLVEGRVQIQSEGADVSYRRAMLTPIAAIPAGLRSAAGLDPDH